MGYIPTVFWNLKNKVLKIPSFMYATFFVS